MLEQPFLIHKEDADLFDEMIKRTREIVVKYETTSKTQELLQQKQAELDAIRRDPKYSTRAIILGQKPPDDLQNYFTYHLGNRFGEALDCKLWRLYTDVYERERLKSV